MTTIRTRYVGPRGFRGSVIVATGQGRQRTVGYDDAMSSEGMHAIAARRLAQVLGLRGTLTTSATANPSRYVHTVGGA